MQWAWKRTGRVVAARTVTDAHLGMLLILLDSNRSGIKPEALQYSTVDR